MVCGDTARARAHTPERPLRFAPYESTAADSLPLPAADDDSPYPPPADNDNDAEKGWKGETNTIVFPFRFVFVFIFSDAFPEGRPGGGRGARAQPSDDWSPSGLYLPAVRLFYTVSSVAAAVHVSLYQGRGYSDSGNRG